MAEDVEFVVAGEGMGEQIQFPCAPKWGALQGRLVGFSGRRSAAEAALLWGPDKVAIFPQGHVSTCNHWLGRKSTAGDGKRILCTHQRKLDYHEA